MNIRITYERPSGDPQDIVVDFPMGPEEKFPVIDMEWFEEAQQKYGTITSIKYKDTNGDLQEVEYER